MNEKPPRPWWAKALLGGVGVGLTLLGALGFSAARAESPKQPATLEQKIDGLSDKISDLREDVAVIQDRMGIVRRPRK